MWVSTWPYLGSIGVDPPKHSPSMLPSYLPPQPEGYVTSRLSCVPCGERVDPDMDDVAEFLKRHGPHIRLFLESMRTGKRITWRAK